MIKRTISEIKDRIQRAGSIKEESKSKLLGLLSTLKCEIEELSKTKAEHAKSIAGFTDISTYEATREDRNPELLKLSIEGLSSSVKGFETSHPKLSEIVNSICLTLSNLGI
ncbi:DUF4404 family protein [bacterium]|nr:DUF4404 family protein [bacterium]